MYYIENRQILLIEAKMFGLSPRTMLGQYADNHLVLIKDRKSRVIMNDGRQILKQIQMIQNSKLNLKISLATNAPVCSKTTRLLKEKRIEILSLKKV